ncbi:MAG: glycosyl hydrolase family 28 protein [Spirosomaceae bacterium]|jgi:polygalacturonase|nr:glycosyl hydrolase family 28 protein [Spirosomataceae bacterium]
MKKTILLFLVSFSVCFGQKNKYYPLKNEQKIVKGIKQTADAQTHLNIQDFRPDPSGQTDSRPAFLAALKQCEASGGCVLQVSAGKYRLDGALHLIDNLHLVLKKNVILSFTPEAKFYLPAVKVRWEGTVAWNYSPMIYAFKKKNITISGEGIIDGNGLEWSKNWRKLQKDDQTKIRKMGNDLVDENLRIFANGYADTNNDGTPEGDGKEHFLRPSLVQLFACEQVRFEGVTFQNSPFWTLNFPFSNHLVFRGLTIKGGPLNDDGLDPDSSQEVLIEDCNIDTHDDAISIKAGRDQDAWNRPKSKNIVIRNCRLKSQTNSFCIGSEMSGGVEDVFVRDCILDGAEYGINFKTNLDRGGEVKNVFLKNLTVGEVKKSLFNFTMAYHSYRGGEFPTKFHDIYAQNIHCEKVGETAIEIIGVEKSKVENVYLRKISVKNAKKAVQLEHTQNISFEKVFVNGDALKK